MPHLTMHTATHTELTDERTKTAKPYLALKRASHDAETGAFRKHMSGGLWVNLSAERTDAEIVRDLADAAMAAIAFAELARAEIERRSVPTPIAAKPSGKKAAA